MTSVQRMKMMILFLFLRPDDQRAADDDLLSFLESVRQRAEKDLPQQAY